MSAYPKTRQVFGTKNPQWGSDRFLRGMRLAKLISQMMIVHEISLSAIRIRGAPTRTMKISSSFGSY